MKTTKYFIGALLTAALVCACENDPYLYKDSDTIWLSGDPTQQATATQTVFSFKAGSNDVRESTLNLIVNLTGEVAGVDRHFLVQVVDSETNVTPAAYELGAMVLPAGARQATLPVKVKRDISDVDLKTEQAKLTLCVVPSSDLGAGIAERSKYSLLWCDYLIKPESWDRTIDYYIGPFTQARYKFIMDFTGIKDIGFNGDYNYLFGLQAKLIRLLNEYNSDPANAGREEGWPYLNDNGEPLQFGSGLTV